jgi:hypothetical protein
MAPAPPPSPAAQFLQMDEAKTRAKAAGVQITDLSIGTPDILPPPEALDALQLISRRLALARWPAGPLERSSAQRRSAATASATPSPAGLAQRPGHLHVLPQIGNFKARQAG